MRGNFSLKNVGQVLVNRIELTMIHNIFSIFFYRESKKVIKRRMDIDRAYKERLSKANNKINSVCMPKVGISTMLLFSFG